MIAKTALIVEDESIIALELRMRLEQLGVVVKAIVPSADKAIETADREHPDLIFMDILLRGKNTGIEAAQNIRKKSKVPIIFVTGNTHLLKAQLLKSLQPCFMIAKPANDWELKEAIELFGRN